MTFRSFFVLAFLLVSQAYGQSQRFDSTQAAHSFTLKEVIDLAKKQSPKYYEVKNDRESRYWAWRAFRANYLPQLVLSGTVPRYINSFEQTRQNDGSIEPRLVNQAETSLNLQLEQNIGLTGGTVFARSALQRVDNFLNNGRSYNSNPAVIGIRQSLFAFNPLYWDKQIEPLIYEESQKMYHEELENISINVTKIFFDLLIAQINLEIARKNRANNDTIYKIAQGRYNLGKIGEDELLQLELAVQKADQEISQANLDLETHALKIKTNIGLTDTQKITLLPPYAIPGFLVDETMAISEAKKNRRAYIAFKRRLLEAQKEVAQARGETGLNGDLFAELGLTNFGNSIPAAYKTPDNQKVVEIRLSIPILDWGRTRARRKTALSSFERTKNIVEQDELNFDQEVYTQVKTFDMLREQLKITGKSDEIAQKRYEISRNRYLIGKISILDLNTAQREKDEARRSYFLSLRNFWDSYYKVRQLTLYDFETQSVLMGTD